MRQSGREHAGGTKESGIHTEKRGAQEAEAAGGCKRRLALIRAEEPSEWTDKKKGRWWWTPRFSVSPLSRRAPAPAACTVLHNE